MAILTVNAGSSSLKFSVYPTSHGSVLPAILSGTFEGLEPGGDTELRYAYQGVENKKNFKDVDGDPFVSALMHLKELLIGIDGLPLVREILCCNLVIQETKSLGNSGEQAGLLLEIVFSYLLGK